MLAIAAAQTPGAAQTTPPANADLDSARNLLRVNLQQIAKVKVPMATEPACHFKA
jgi:hypothetical protein